MSVDSKSGLFQATYHQMVSQSFKQLYQTVYAAEWLAVLIKTVKYSHISDHRFRTKWTTNISYVIGQSLVRNTARTIGSKAWITLVKYSGCDCNWEMGFHGYCKKCLLLTKEMHCDLHLKKYINLKTSFVSL